MTFCVGMKVRKGLVGIADTLVTTGTESITAGKSLYISTESIRCFL